jgi:hypothetical protein
MKSIYCFLSALLLFFASCTTEEIGNSRDVNPATIYSAYKIVYTEGEPSASCTAQFRFGGENGTTLILNDTSRIQLDGETIKPDSSQYRGAFYETYKDLPAFTGDHSFTFRDIHGKQYTENFSFHPVSLAQPLPLILEAGDFVLNFTGTEAGDSISVSASDSSKSTFDNEQSSIVANGRVLVGSSLFDSLTYGPVKFTIYVRRKKRIIHCPEEGGVFIQEFILKEITSMLVPKKIIT